MNRLLIAFLLILISQDAAAFLAPKHARQNDHFIRPRLTADQPYTEIAVHNIGNVWMTVTNYGQFGTGATALTDPLTGQEAPSCMFPAASNLNYLYVGAFWIGAVVGRDTLVSIGIDDYYDVQEFWPDPAPRGEIVRRSIQESNLFYDEEAVSEQDIIAVYTDTVTNPLYVSIDNTDGRTHVPLGIEITQRSYAWSYDYAEDFILFDYSIKNIGRNILNSVYMAVYIDGDVHHESSFGPEGYGDDICGFLQTFPADVTCGDFIDTINVAYITDNDGDPGEDGGDFNPNSATGLAGVRIVRTPSDSLIYSFNWWATDYSSAALDFGPRKIGTPEDPFREFGGYLGTPLGDRNKYYVMRHQEFDYDQLFTARDNTAEDWLPRPSNAIDIADGYDARYLLSFGPFDIHPGEVLPLSFAWVCGEDLHRDPRAFENSYHFATPEAYYSTFDFSDMAANAVWASWVYDNPGVDTDEDGFRGQYWLCCVDSSLEIDNTVTPPETTVTCSRYDTLYYEGDGVPDFRGAAPPPAPKVRIIPQLTEDYVGRFIVRWNGLQSELTRDAFSGRLDFEGYRIFQSLNPSSDDFVMIASYDMEDYNRYVYDNAIREWVLLTTPFDLNTLRDLYGAGFDPLSHDIDNPLYVSNPDGPDSAFYFARQDWNRSDLSDPLGIHKVYPDQAFPTVLDPDSAALYAPDELTEDGYLKYFEYEYVLNNLLPSQYYYISVTAFDYGSPGHGLASLETKVTVNMVADYPQNSARLAEDEGLDVIVYPNPYRIDGRYRQIGFEGRGQEHMSDERVRAIHFTNLPHQCTIRIFSLDGDLVREIKHDYAPGEPEAMHDSWDLITRNTQAVVSGIYYYSVESRYGNQVGKIVIIM